SDHPQVAERATRLAHQLDLNSEGLEAVERWRTLAPDDERSNWFAGVLETRANRLPRAVERVESFIRGIGDPSTGFALVLEALGNEPYASAGTAVMRALESRFPDVPMGDYALARLALRSGDFDLALTHAAAASDSDPDWVEARLLYAR